MSFDAERSLVIRSPSFVINFYILTYTFYIHHMIAVIQRVSQASVVANGNTTTATGGGTTTTTAAVATSLGVVEELN